MLCAQPTHTLCTRSEKAMPDVLGSLDAFLAGKEFLEGGRFTVSDVAVGAYL